MKLNNSGFIILNKLKIWMHQLSLWEVGKDFAYFQTFEVLMQASRILLAKFLSLNEAL